jgi:hypothetical protein
VSVIPAAVGPALPADGACPVGLQLERIGAFLNAELADHPVYDGIEVQRFDDAEHGRGMLAFLGRRADRRVDYYVTPGLRLERAGYELGAGTGGWFETDVEAATLRVDDGGVLADVRFRDRDGRAVTLEVDDRDAGPRRTGRILAPVGASIERPTSLALVVLDGFDLLRRTSTTPRIVIDGERVATGELPGARLHRRHLVKVAAPLLVVTVGAAHDGPLPRPAGSSDAAPVGSGADGSGVRRRSVAAHGSRASLRFQPGLPTVTELEPGSRAMGRWEVELDGRPLTGGRYAIEVHEDRGDLRLDVTDPWRPPPGLPALLRTVTRVIPTFRRWPTTYRWTATVRVVDGQPHLTAGWDRTGGDRGRSYRRLTRS